MTTVRFKRLQGANFDELNKIFLGTARNTLNDEVKRIRRQRFAPLVRGWKSQNRTSFRTKQFKPRNGARAVINATDKEDDKRLFKWVHQTGVRPHRIAPTKSHGLLVWEARGGGTVFHRGAVNHPGFPSSGEHERMLREELPKMLRRLENDLGGKFAVLRS